MSVDDRADRRGRSNARLLCAIKWSPCGTKRTCCGLYALAESPVGLAAWILEKWRTWSDCDGDLESMFTREELLTLVSVYWFTRTINSANRLYYESRAHPVALVAGQRVLPPAGFLFERPRGHTIGPPPRARADEVYDVRRWTVADRGCHFPALENPELYVEEVRSFFRPLRPA